MHCLHHIASEVAEDDEGWSLLGRSSVHKEPLIRDTHQPLISGTLQSTKYSRDVLAVSIAR